jgi:HD-GYP domain-containing protein (c-di-GMP phosphodiesterase class II)
MKMSNDEVKQLRVIGNLHDIGKIAIDEGVLNKPGKLTPEEWTHIRRHPETGYRILSASPDYVEIAEDILCHHERWDGKGYPKGLSGNKIPIHSRIIALADAYDAMTENRPYRNTLTPDEALREILDNAGTQFDPDLAVEFANMIKENFGIES